jgi:RND family efflux transporter MFP subunit
MLIRTKRSLAIRFVALGFLVLMLLSAISGCDKSSSPAEQQTIPKVTTAAVFQQETTDYDEYTGRTEASETVDIHARVFGYLKSIEFKDGDFVKEGQTLFTIEPDEYQAIYNQSLSKITVWESKLEVAKADLARRKATMAVSRGAVSQEEYEQYVAAVREADANLTSAKADANRTAIDLNYTVVAAPISGRVDRAFVSKGTLLTGGVSSGTLLTKIVDEQPMYVYFDVDERSLLKYMRQRDKSQSAPGNMSQRGIDCYLQLADEKDFPHKGKLDFIESEVSTGTGTARIRGVFENKDDALASGLFVRVRIPASQPYQAILIPERALATDQSVKYVYVVGDDGVATRRTVELGPQRGEMRIISSGLKLGERVIVKGLQRVRPGQKVEATSESNKVAANLNREPVSR